MAMASRRDDEAGRRPGDRARSAGRRFLVIAAGYAVAALVADLVTVAHLALPTVLPDRGSLGSFFAFWRDGPSLVLVGLGVVASTALPGFLVVLAYAAWRGWRDALRFGIAGGLNAFPALWLFGAFSGGLSGTDPFFVFCCVGGGLSGGFAYWLCAESRRNGAGLTAPAPTGS